MLVTCPQCSQSAEVSIAAIGKQGRCPRCRHVFVLAANVALAPEAVAGEASAVREHFAPPLHPTSGLDAVPNPFVFEAPNSFGPVLPPLNQPPAPGNGLGSALQNSSLAVSQVATLSVSEQWKSRPIGLLLFGPVLPVYQPSNTPAAKRLRWQMFWWWLRLYLVSCGLSLLACFFAGAMVFIFLGPMGLLLGPTAFVMLMGIPTFIFFVGLLWYSGSLFGWAMRDRRMKVMRSWYGDEAARDMGLKLGKGLMWFGIGCIPLADAIAFLAIAVACVQGLPGGSPGLVQQGVQKLRDQREQREQSAAVEEIIAKRAHLEALLNQFKQELQIVPTATQEDLLRAIEQMSSSQVTDFERIAQRHERDVSQAYRDQGNASQKLELARINTPFANLPPSEVAPHLAINFQRLEEAIHQRRTQLAHLGAAESNRAFEIQKAAANKTELDGAEESLRSHCELVLQVAKIDKVSFKIMIPKLNELQESWLNARTKVDQATFGDGKANSKLTRRMQALDPRYYHSPLRAEDIAKKIATDEALSQMPNPTLAEQRIIEIAKLIHGGDKEDARILQFFVCRTLLRYDFETSGRPSPLLLDQPHDGF